jgi:hypothetical protein
LGFTLQRTDVGYQFGASLIGGSRNPATKKTRTLTPETTAHIKEEVFYERKSNV